jgi:hypothetical protein
LDLTFGERTGARAESDLGGYSLLIEYRIDAERGIPDWVLSWPDERMMRSIAPLLCPMGFGGGGRFPDCPDLPAGFAVFHPRFRTPDCLADGPGCMELSSFFWDGQSPFSMRMRLPAGFEAGVLDAARNRMASAKSAAARNAKGPIPSVDLSANLKPGLHFLAVKGPPGNVSAFLSGVAGAPAEAIPGTGTGRFRLPALAVFLLVAAVLAVAVMAGRRKRAG